MCGSLYLKISYLSLEGVFKPLEGAALQQAALAHDGVGDVVEHDIVTVLRAVHLFDAVEVLLLADGLVGQVLHPRQAVALDLHAEQPFRLVEVLLHRPEPEERARRGEEHREDHRVQPPQPRRRDEQDERDDENDERQGEQPVGKIALAQFVGAALRVVCDFPVKFDHDAFLSADYSPKL